MATKQNDWLATLYYNPDLDLSDLKKLDITPDNTDFKTASEYKNMSQIAEIFKTEDGQFDNKKFDAFYRGAAQLYNNYANNEYVERLPELLGHINSQWDAPLDAPIIDTAPHFVSHDEENDSAFGLSVIGREGKSPWANKTPTEIAESQEVVDYVTGEGLGWTPEDKGGIFKGLTRPTLVLATYDEDTTETVNGIDVIHRAGDLKYRNGKPYFETLGDRDPSKKQVLAWTNTFTRESSKWNKYDFFDSDDYEKSFVGTLAKTAFTIAPYFIPYLNYAWAAITATEALARVTPVIGKAINGIWTGDPNTEFKKNMNIFQGAMMRFDTPVTQKSQDNLVTFENFGNLVAMIGGQLTQQQAIATIPMLLNGMKATDKTAKWGQHLALSYMALTSAQDSYDTFKDAGASDRVAGWAFLANTLALRGLMGIDYFRDNVFKHTYMDESQVRVPLFSASKKLNAGLIAEGETVKTAEEAAHFIGKVQKFYHENLLNSAKSGIVQRMFSEGTEEVMEETVLDLSKLGTKLMESFGGNLSENQDPLDFKTDLKDITSRYGMAFFGGMLGGAMFAGQQKYWKWLGNETSISDLDDDFKKLVYYVADGKADEMRDWLNTWHKKGLLGSKNLTSKLSSVESIDGTTPIMEQISSSNNISQNDATYQGMMKFIDTMEEIVKSEGLNITPQNLLNIKKLGFTPSKELLNADILVDSMQYSNLTEDYLNLAKDIVETNVKLKEAILDVTVKEDTPDARSKTEENIKNSQEIKKLQQHLSELRQKRDAFHAGEYNWQYATQALFALNDTINSKFANLSLEDFSKLYQKDYDTLSAEEKQTVKQNYDNYKKNYGKYNVLQSAEVYRQLAVTLAPVFEKLTVDLKGVRADANHKVDNYGQTTYSEIYNKRKEIAERLKTLRLKESVTEEDNKAIDSLERELADTTNKLIRMSANPSSMLVSSQNGELYNIGTVLQNPVLTDNDWSSIYNGLQSIYNTYADTDMIMNGDTELDALYNRIRNDFAVIPSIQRITTYMQAKYATMPISEDDDPEVPNSIQTLSDDTTKDGNIWFNYYADDDTPFQRHIADLITQFVNAVGLDNAAAEKIYQQIKQEFKNNTNVSDADVEDALRSILPNIAGKSLYEIMHEFDDVRKNIKYVPLADVLDNFFFQYTGRKTKLLQLIKEEERRLATAENLSEYLIYDSQTQDDLNTINKILDAVGAVILGATNKMNASINAFNDNPEPLAILDEHTSDLLINAFDTLYNRVRYLLDLAKYNKDRQLKAHEDIDKNMRSKFLKAVISPSFAKMFADTFKYTDINGIEHEIDPNEIWQEVAPSDLVWDTIAMIDEAKLRKAEADFSQKMYEEMSKLPYFEDDAKLAKMLVPLFGKNVSFMQTTILGKEGSEVVSQYSLLNYVMSMLGMGSAKFNTQYKLSISQDDFDFAPVYGQEFAVRNLVGFMARSGLYNAVIEEMSKKENILLSKDVSEFEKNHIYDRAKLYNMYVISGGSGTGKSSGVVGTISAMLKNHMSHQFITMAKSEILAKNLANIIQEDNVQSFSFEKFKNDVFGRDFGAYRVDTNNGHFYLESTVDGSKTGLFDTSKELKIFVIDEITLFTEEELNAISKWAKERGILVIGLGDPLQNSATVKIGDTYQNSGLEDTVYMGAPMLTASFRSANLAQKTNMENLYNRLYDVYVQSTKSGAWDAKQYDAALNSEELPIEFYEDTRVFLGTKIVDNANIIDEARKWKGKGSIAIIYDESSKVKYESVDESGITLVPYNDMQGREFDYVFVDVNWEKHSRLSPTFVSKYNVLRDFYTVSQRATTAGVILDNGLRQYASIVQFGSNSDMNRQFDVDKSQKDRFKEDRLRAMDGLSEEEGFNTAFNTPKIVTTAKKTKDAPENREEPKRVPAAAPITTEPSSITEAIAVPKSSGMGVPPVDAQMAPVKSSNTPPVDIQPTRLPEKNDAIANNNDWYAWLYDPIKFNELEYNNAHSLMNVANKLGLNLNNIQNFDYKDFIGLVASHIRTGQNVSDWVSGDLTEVRFADSDVAEQLIDYFKNKPEFRINPIDGSKSLLTARFYNSEDYITIPVMIVDTVKEGVYKGDIRKISKADKGESGKWVTLEQFVINNPGVSISDGAILSISPDKADVIQKSTEYLDSTKNMLLNQNNKGNLGYVFSDEPSIANRRFNWVFNDDAGFILKPYSDVALMFAQSRLSLVNVLNYAMAMASVKNPDHKNTKSLVEYYNEPLFTDVKATLSNILGLNYDNIPAKGAERYQYIHNNCQIFDLTSLARFMQVSIKFAQTNRVAAQIFSNLDSFLSTERGLNKNKDYWVKNLIWLKAGDNNYAFETFEQPDGSKNVLSYTYNPNTGDLIPYKSENASNISDIIKDYFGDVTPEAYLMEHLYHYVNDSPDGTYKVQLLDANDQIYFTYRGIAFDPAINRVFETLEVNDRIPYKNGIYIQVKGAKSSTENDSMWLPAQTHNRTIWVDLDNITYSRYAIDQSQIEPFEEAKPKKTELEIIADNTLSTIKQFLESRTDLVLKLINKDTFGARSLNDLMVLLKHNPNIDYTKGQSILDEINEWLKESDTWRMHRLIWNDGNILDTMVDDFELFINQLTGEIPVKIYTETFNTWNFGIYMNDAGEYGIISKNNNRWEVASFKTADDFFALLDTVKSDPSGLLMPYVYSMVITYNSALNAIAEKAADYLYQNIANEQLRAIYEQINNYLQKRLENGEC